MPASDVSLPINSPENVTFTCNVSQDESNMVERQAIWEVEGRQIQSGPVRDAFARIGVLIEEEEVGIVDLIVTSEGRMVFQDGIMVRCTAFTLNPPVTEVGEPLFIRTYGW